MEDHQQNRSQNQARAFAARTACVAGILAVCYVVSTCILGVSGEEWVKELPWFLAKVIVGLVLHA